MTYDIKSDPFTDARISGRICATYEWRIVNQVDTRRRPLRNALDFLSHDQLVEALWKVGFDVRLDLSDRIVELLGDRRISVLSLPFAFDLPSGEERLDVSIRAYVFRSPTDELAIQEHNSGYRPALPGISPRPRKGSEILRCSLRCHGDRIPEETGRFAQRVNDCLERVSMDLEMLYASIDGVLKK